MSIVEATGGGVILLGALFALRGILPQVPWVAAALLSILTAFRRDLTVHERMRALLPEFEAGLKASKRDRVNYAPQVRLGSGTRASASGADLDEGPSHP